MFYNTLTHMVQSGIGQNGSRSATEEHKSPFLETVNYFLRLLDDSEDKLIKDMIEMSYLYGKLDPAEYPKVKRERLKDTDLEAMSTNILRLAQAQAIRITDKDEEHLRELFGLPELSLEEITNEETVTEQENEQEETEEQEEQEDSPVEMKTLKRGEDPRINIDRARGFLDDTTEKAKKIVENTYNKLVANIAGQMAKRPNKAPKYRYKDELFKCIG
jgi:hypothetical protein